MTASTPTLGFDLSSPEFWAQGPEAKLDAFALLRRERPVSYWAESEWLVPDVARRGNGYWALTKYDDIMAVSRDPELFCSAQGMTVGEVNPKLLELFGSMIVMDDPRHARLRRIVSAGFTPRMLKRVEDSVQRIASRIVDNIAERGECDFVTEVAAALPLQIICDMMGIPESQYGYVLERTNTILGGSDIEYIAEGVDIPVARNSAARELAELMETLAADRRGKEGDDLTTILVNATVDGERLTGPELTAFFNLLTTAGNETTRNAISHGMRLLHDHPDQRAIWAADFDDVAATAVEEIVRWSSPVVYMRRTATADTVIRGQEIRAGEKILLFYLSANHDEDHFENAREFDVRRAPNAQLGFGGPGPHFCLGAHLARREMTVMFRELFTRLPDLAVAGPADYLRSSFIHGVKHLPCRFTPTR